MALCNPYQDEIDRLCKPTPGLRLAYDWDDEHEVEQDVLTRAAIDKRDMRAWMDRSIKLFGKMFLARDGLVTRYSWAVPTEEAVLAIAELSPIVEWCAGTGYWSWLLRQAGAQVTAFSLRPGVQGCDRKTGEPQQHECWTEVLPTDGDERAVKAVLGSGAVAARCLLLVWPPYDDPVAYHCLRQFRGEWCVHVGESAGGCTGDEQFHDLLAGQWVETRCINIPSWRGIRDDVWIYRRKRRQTRRRKRLISVGDEP